MRDVTKAMMSFSWAVSCFGMQQLGRMISAWDRDTQSRMCTEFENVSKAAEANLSDTMKQTCRAGDEWQRRMVDMMFGGGGAGSGSGWDARSAMRRGADFMQRSAQSVRDAAAPRSTSAPTGGARCGTGPDLSRCGTGTGAGDAPTGSTGTPGVNIPPVI